MGKLALSVATFSLAMCLCAPAKAEDTISYKVVRGDTLIGLAERNRPHEMIVFEHLTEISVLLRRSSGCDP